MVNRLNSAAVQLRRRYWTATTFRSSSPHKLVEAIQQNISAFPAKPPTAILDRPSVLLFTISKRIPSELLEALVKSFQSLVPEIEPIGCLTQDSSIDLYSASIAKWSGRSADLVPFTSTIPSRPSISVGREILPSNEGAESRGDYTGHAHQVGAESTPANQLPEELRRIPSASSVELSYPFLNILQRTFPSAMLMGLLGSATAFETGRPSTLFRGRSILGHGAVGIAVLKPSHTSTASPIVRYTNMRTLGDPMKVTRSQGNIILTLDSRKATSCLLEVIKKSDDINESARSSELIISKEKEFYLGFLNEQHMVVEICRIIGASTSRGTMALDREKEIKVDQMVQFIHSSELAGGTGIERAHGQAPEPSPTMSPVSTETIELEFSCSDGLSSGPPGLGSQDDVGKVETIEGVFCGASEAGFVPSHQTIVNLAHSRVQYKL